MAVWSLKYPRADSCAVAFVTVPVAMINPLDSTQLTTLQVCPRRLIIESQRASEKLWRPKELYEHCIRQALLNVSAGMSIADATLEAVTVFVERATRPGLLTAHKPYCIAQDWIAILKVSITALATVAGGFTEVPLVSRPSWKCLSLMGNDGRLHRWTTVAKFSRDLAAADLQSWAVVGDICATGLEMTVHFIETGVGRGGHQHTPWCRIFAHPAIPGRFAFQQKDGSPLEGNWKPVWFQNSPNNDIAHWLAMMERDQVKLIHDVRVKSPDASQRARFERDLAIERARIASLPKLEELPIFRPACNFPQVCQWQWICYAE